MKQARFLMLALLAVAMVSLAACTPASVGSLVGLSNNNAQAATPIVVPTTTPRPATAAATGGTVTASGTSAAGTSAAGATSAAPAAATPAAAGTAAVGTAPAIQGPGLAVAGDLQSQLMQVYKAVNPSVVAIEVTEGQSSGSNVFPFGNPNNPNGQGGIVPQQAAGSGFIFDNQGHIVTNNHVVDGATSIRVIFYDGRQVSAKLVGQDPDDDLAVIQVSTSGLNLQPVSVGDSTSLQVGQFVVAMGNPFDEQNTMTFGIVSALGRSLPATSQSGFSNQPTFTIPDIIQTDAPINPGNSGGVLLDLQGRVVGVPSAIDSSSGSGSGIGFAIPASIVQKAVPSLISTGKVEHPYLGISGTTLNPDLAQAMKLDPSQRGALVIDVTQGGPAEQAGVQPSTNQVTLPDGTQGQVGGDVIVAIDNQPVNTFDDIVTYLSRSTKVGQTVTLTVLRNGKQQQVKVTLAARPAQAPAPAITPRVTRSPRLATPAPGTQATPPAGGATAQPPAAGATPGAQATPGARANAWLGVTIIGMTQEIAQAMNLPANTQGALVEQVVQGSPAQQAGLIAGEKAFTTANGVDIVIGGDVITAIDGKALTNDTDLVRAVSQDQPGQKITLTVLRNGSTVDVSVTLGTRP